MKSHFIRFICAVMVGSGSRLARALRLGDDLDRAVFLNPEKALWKATSPEGANGDSGVELPLTYRYDLLVTFD
jgi:hypothetical protein